MVPGQTSDEPCRSDSSEAHGGRHPLGPLVWRERLARPVWGRLVAAALALACAGVLGVAVWLQPDPRGYGTHKGLGEGPCGFLVRTGFPCPTCGMTTAFSLTVRGRIADAFRTQALGLLLTLATGVCGLGCAAITVTGKTWVVNWYRISPIRVVWGLGIALILAWGIKIAIGLYDGSLPARTF